MTSLRDGNSNYDLIDLNSNLITQGISSEKNNISKKISVISKVTNQESKEIIENSIVLLFLKRFIILYTYFEQSFLTYFLTVYDYSFTDSKINHCNYS